MLHAQWHIWKEEDRHIICIDITVFRERVHKLAGGARASRDTFTNGFAAAWTEENLDWTSTELMMTMRSSSDKRTTNAYLMEWHGNGWMTFSLVSHWLCVSAPPVPVPFEEQSVCSSSSGNERTNPLQIYSQGKRARFSFAICKMSGPDIILWWYWWWCTNYQLLWAGYNSSLERVVDGVYSR